MITSSALAEQQPATLRDGRTRPKRALTFHEFAAFFHEFSAFFAEFAAFFDEFAAFFADEPFEPDL